MNGQIITNIAVKNLAEAHQFYGTVLGLPVLAKIQANYVLYGTPNNALALIESPSKAGTSDSIIASFFVPNINEAAQQLKGKGIKFKFESEDKDSINIFKTEGLKSIIFYDQDNNVLSIAEMIR